MARFVAVCLLLVGCATGAESPLAMDSSVEELDAAADAEVIDAQEIDAPPPDACVANTEACNMADDDCDGHIDEGYSTGLPCDGADTDQCSEGFVVCSAMGDTTCSDVTSNNVEKCNGLDDDCMNGVDDTFAVGQPCSVGLGACARAGQLVCNSVQTGTVCNAMAGAPQQETCGNSVDEDCNGADVTCPGNDTAAGAIDISAGGTFTVDLSAAHDDNWAASTATLDCGDQGGRDVFYQFTLPAEEVVYFDTFGANFDTVVRVFAGACGSLGAVKACADDACSTTRSQGALDLLAGTYCLVVDQYGATTTAGSVSLSFKRGGRSGVALPAMSGNISGTTTGKNNYTIAGCEANSAQPDVGHFFLTCPNRTYSVAASTCSGTAFDSILYLRTGSASTGDVACSDDVSGCGNNLQAYFTGATVGGPNLNWLIVDGFGQTGNGNYTLSYSVQ